MFKKLFLSVVFIGLTAPLGGCESVDTAMNDMQQRFSDMNWEMPVITPKSDKDTYIDGERMARPTLARLDEKGEKPAAIEVTYPAEEPGASPAMLAGDANCPSVSVIEELKALHQFENPDRPSPATKISEIAMTDLKTGCKHTGNTVAVEIDLTFDGKLGPAARVTQNDQPRFAYPYFIAITTPNGNIIAKEVFAATVAYNKGEDEVTHNESLRQVIPLAGEFDTDHALLIGFQLSEGELAYNRSVMGMPDYLLGDIATDDPPPSITEEPAPKKTAAAKPPVKKTWVAAKPPRKPEQIAAKPAPVEVKEPEKAAAAEPPPSTEPMASEAQALEARMNESMPAPVVSTSAPAAAPEEAAAISEIEPAAEADEVSPMEEEIAPGAVYNPEDPAPAQQEAIDITAD